MGNLESEIQYLPGVGPKRAALLRSELGVETFGDLIHVYPFRYIDRSGITRIADISSDMAYVQICGTIASQSETPGRKLSIFVDDGSGRMEMVFFKGIKWNKERLTPGKQFIFFGKPSEFNGRFNIVHPDVDTVESSVTLREGRLSGIYNSTEKLKNGGITMKLMTKLQAAALRACLPEIQETLPEYILKAKSLTPLKYALTNIHFPQDQYALQQATYRLKFEELLFLQLSLLKQKFTRSHGSVGIMMPKVGEDFRLCYSSLPYELTGAQKRVIKEIRSDMMSGHQMNRLIQGDVGSGKTMVAVLSCLIAWGNGFQSCIMAPTEVLAQQHYRNISRYLEGTEAECALLTGSTGAKERRRIHEGLENGSIAIIVGTHALIEDNVKFSGLGLAVIDEQHRFGVEQRSRLWAKGPDMPPHVLVMTATPIPRTLAMTLYGDLDISVIDEMPPGRKPIKTMLISPARKKALYKFMKQEIAAGHQVFVVYPLIFESEKTDLRNLEQGYEEIVSEFPLPDYKVAIVHGQQSNEDKEFNMSAFAAGRADILVSTTVIEVGVDVPNASVMVIESAQRFGLSQLHQLRGRVGRGADNAYCILVKDFKTSKESQKRLDLMCQTQNGFEIAEEDMKMRGPGDIEGTQQSGLPITLNIASLSRDGRLLEEARQTATEILRRDPSLQEPQNSLLSRELRKDKYNIRDYSVIS